MRKLSYIWFPFLLILFLIPMLNLEIFYEGFLLLIFMYSSITAGWNILAGYTGYPSFGHVSFFGLGAYTTAILLLRYGLSPFITCILGGVVAASFALLIGYPTLRLKGAYFAIATLSLGFVLQILFLNLGPITGGGEGLSLPLTPWDIKTTTHIFYYAMLLVLLASTFTTYMLEKSKFGLAFKCIRDDELAAESSGVPTTKLKMMAFLLSAFFPGMAGGLYSYYASYIDPITVFDPKISMFVIVFTIFGGGGTVLGPILGTTILFSIGQIMRYSFTIPGIDLIVFSVIAIAVILFMPQGIIGVLREKYRIKLP